MILLKQKMKRMYSLGSRPRLQKKIQVEIDWEQLAITDLLLVDCLKLRITLLQMLKASSHLAIRKI
jgi:hypothetical protein